MTPAAPDKIALLLQEVEVARRSGRASEADRALAALLAEASDHPVANNIAGLQALEQGDVARAIHHLAIATRADPEAAPLWMNLAKAQRQAGDAAGEGASLERALAIDQRHFMALVRRAELHERLGELGPAQMRWAAVLALAPSLPHSDALAALTDHASRFVAAQGQAFARAIAPALEAAREGLEPQAHRRFDVAVEAALGRRRIYHNSCAGLHVPFLPADEFFARDHFPWLAQIEAHTAAIRDEFVALAAGGLPGFEPYVQQDRGTPANPWTPLDGSMKWGALHLWKMGKRIDAACAACPVTAAAVESLPLAEMSGRAPSVFFSVLQPHTRIPPHTGVSNSRAIVHLPLIVPPGCGFRVGGDTRAWVEGEAFAFDDTIEHEAWNDSDRIRAVLIFDVWNPHLSQDERRLLQAFFAAADASGFAPGSTAAAD